jgi:hypothetical protein
MAVLLSLFVVVGLCHGEYRLACLQFLLTASGVMTPFRRVSLLRRDISVSYVLLDAGEVIVCVFCGLKDKTTAKPKSYRCS